MTGLFLSFFCLNWQDFSDWHRIIGIDDVVVLFPVESNRSSKEEET